MEDELRVCVALDDVSLGMARAILFDIYATQGTMRFADLDRPFCEKLIRLIDHRIECLVKGDARYAQSQLTAMMKP